MIRILICDDQEIVAEGLRIILNTVSDFDVVATVYNGYEAVEYVEEDAPDIILMDLNMPIMNGVQATRRIREKLPDIKILVLTTYDDDEWVFDAVRSGASGYLLKDTPREELVAAIRGTVAGKAHIDPHVAGKIMKQMARSGANFYSATSIGQDLTERELEILRLLTEGLTNAEIAERTCLSKGTVGNYISSIFEKLEVVDRTQAAVLAVRYGLV